MKNNEKIAPLPSESENITKNNNNKMYAFCRVTGGMYLSIICDDGTTENIVLKSGNKSKISPDNVRTFEINPDKFGITELTVEQATKCEELLKPTGTYKRGFVFFTDDINEGNKKASEQLKKYPLQGTEQLGEEVFNNVVSKYEEK